MGSPAVRVEDLGKMYRLGATVGPRSVRDSAESAEAAVRSLLSGRRPVSRRHEFIWALRHVGFEVAHGEMVGIIGRNGAGKSTLLKVLSRITQPTEGRGEIHGRLGSLLEVGTGFHQELTGRENVYLSGAIHGMSKRDTDRLFDEIVEFAGVEKFIDTPVKRYSSGMYVRLAFAVAAFLESEILLLDEVLAVGDYQFQKKCLGRMGEIASQGRTVLLVSHSMASIRNFCSRAILLDKGRVVVDDTADKTVDAYLAAGGGEASLVEWPDPAERPGDDVVRLASVSLVDGSGLPINEIGIADECCIAVEYVNAAFGTRLCCHVELLDAAGTQVLWAPDLPSASSVEDEWFDKPMPAGRYRTVCRLPAQVLNDKTYWVSVTVASDITTVRARAEKCISFTVRETGEMRFEYSAASTWPGAVRVRAGWETTRLDTGD